MLTQKIKITKESNKKQEFQSYHKKLILIKNNQKNTNATFLENNMPNSNCKLNFWGVGPIDDELMF